jgi:hypothetical protein
VISVAAALLTDDAGEERHAKVFYENAARVCRLE